MRSGPERFIQNIVPDLRDNMSSEKAPVFATKTIESIEDALPLVERFLPNGVKEQFLRETSEFEPGEYRARVAVGSAEEGTRHPHDYVVQKGDTDLTLYFVDPEHQMGMSKKRSRIPIPRKGDMRPKISTLIGMRMSEDTPIPDISMIRYRAAAITDPHLLKMGPQFEVAKELFATGTIPEILRGKENEVTFRLNVRPEELIVQSRYAHHEELMRFLEGKISAPTLEGKLHSYGAILRQFLKHLRENRFRSTEAITEKRAE
jgi:hypothetical protein